MINNELVWYAFLFIIEQSVHMTSFKNIENLKLHSSFLERNRELVEAIRDKKPRSVVSGIYQEIRQLYLALKEQERIYTLRSIGT